MNKIIDYQLSSSDGATTELGMNDELLLLGEMNFDHLIDLLRSENSICENMEENLQFFTGMTTPAIGDLFHFASPTVSMGMEEGEGGGGGAEENGVAVSKKEKVVDRSRTLISERRRRGRMKEKLYALRALVPNITKMDRASIIGDAVLYVKELQAQAKKLKAEIAELQSSISEAGNKCKAGIVHENSITTIVSDSNAHAAMCRIIIQVAVSQVGEREFYVRVVSSKGQGVAVSLYRALESLTNFLVQSSNLTTAPDSFIFTSTLIVDKERRGDTSLSEMKMWIKGALLSHGFQFQTA